MTSFQTLLTVVANSGQIIHSYPNENNTGIKKQVSINKLHFILMHLEMIQSILHLLSYTR